MSPGKKGALIAGVGLGLVLVILTALSKDLAVSYHVGLLREDPSKMTEWISEPEDSLRRIALGRYVRTTRGVEVLRRHALSTVINLFAAANPEFHPRALREYQIVHFGMYKLGTYRYLLVDGPTTLTVPVPSEAREQLDPQIPLLDLVTSGDFELAEYPGVRFSLWSYREDLEGRAFVLEGQMVGGVSDSGNQPGSER